MLNINVTGETKYLSNTQIYTACHRKYHNKSSLTQVKKILQTYLKKCLPSRLFYRLFIRFLPEKQCLSPANADQDFSELSL